MKRIVEKVKTHRKIVHAHLKKHHKKYLFGFLSAALLIKIIPALIAGIATRHFNFSFADDNPQSTNNTEITGTNGEENGGEENGGEENGGEENGGEENGGEENGGEGNGGEENGGEGNGGEENGGEGNGGEGNGGEENGGEGNGGEGNGGEGNGGEGNGGEENGGEENGGEGNGGDTEISYTVTYTDGVEEEEVFADQVTTGLSLGDDIPEFNGTPTRTGYTFSGWNPEVTGNVSGDRTYTAQWNINDDGDSGNGTEIVENNTCNGSVILINLPLSGSHLKSENVRLTWTLSGSACSGKTFAIKLYNGNSSGSYTLLGTVPSNSGEFTNLANFNISGSVETNFAIYLVEDGEIIESLKEGPTFFIDDTKPELLGSTYTFDPSRTITYGLNDRVNISFTGSEELTGITVNVLGRNATFQSKSGLKYNYSIQLSSGNNTGQFGYNISFRDLAGNTGYYEYFNSGLTSDTTKPALSGIEFSRISATAGFVSLTTTKPSNITFKYVLSGGRATETLNAQNTTGMRSNLTKARTDKSGYVYKYVITLEDLLGNKNYYAGTFQLSGDDFGYTLVTANGSTISNRITTNILSTLSNEINIFSGCKMSTGMRYKSMQYTVQNRYWFKAEVPTFDDRSIQTSAELLVSLLAGTGGLSKSSITGLTQPKVNSFQEDLNNYLAIVKLKREPGVCNANLSILPTLYMSKFMKTLKSYKLIK